jgi:hypothetical protein
MSKTVVKDNATAKAEETHPILRVAMKLDSETKATDLQLKSETDALQRKARGVIEGYTLDAITGITEALQKDSTEKGKAMREHLITLSRDGSRINVAVGDPMPSMKELVKAKLVWIQPYVLFRQGHAHGERRIDYLPTDMGKEVAKRLELGDVLAITKTATPLRQEMDTRSGPHSV